MKRINAESLGELSDRVDNLIGALQLPMPPQFHVDRLKAALPEIRNDMREIYLNETGENPWGDNP